jgi:tRNA-Thr(GGU) m(6)t(6)A37 methyltransferase TsaA
VSGAISFTPIGVARTPFKDRVSAPRQPYAAQGARGTIELFAGRGLEHAVEDLLGWDYLWVIFCFHLNAGWRPKVLPPRSGGKRRGVLSTRSPHRPNPIGLSLVKLEDVAGLVLHVQHVDMIDGSPVLDIKPYLPYAEAHPEARTGWLKPLVPVEAGAPAAADPEPGFVVEWTERAQEQQEYLQEEWGIDLKSPVQRTLSMGPQPHPYRRIRRDGDAMVLAVKDWRVRFSVDGRRVTVACIETGYRQREIAGSEAPAVIAHRAFVARFGKQA